MAATADIFPVSYRDPVYASLDAGTEAKLGLPDGMVSSIRTEGEKTNADRVSSAGARTPYQITPETRDAALKKWGIDAWLSPRNASEVSGLLLKDSLARNNGNPGLAVAEYHGGTDPANWGPKTKAYVERVTGAMGAAAAPAQPAGPQDTGGVQLPVMQGPSTFDRAQAQLAQTQAPNKLAALYQAYSGGQMTPDEAQQYEQDVRSGTMMLPRGASLKTDTGPGVGGAVAGSTQQVPPQVLQAYQGGQMTPHEMVDFEHDVRHGAWQLPDGVTPDALFGPPHQPAGVMDRIKDTVTGNDRRTATTDALPDWAGMPELNQLSMAGAKTGLGTLLSNPQETAQVIQANFPGVQVRQDQKGNFILRSSVDGQEYAIKPGFQVSDIPRAAAGALAFTPAGRAETVLGAGLKSAATQAAIEGTQAATGGEFNPGEVATAGVLGAGGMAASRVLDLAASPAKALIGRVMGKTEPAVADVRAAVTPGGASEAGAPAAVQPAAVPMQPGPAVVPPATPAATPAAVAKLRERLESGGQPYIDSSNSAGQTTYFAKGVGSVNSDWQVPLELTTDERRAVRYAEASANLAETAEERVAAKQELVDALTPAARRAAAGPSPSPVVPPAGAVGPSTVESVAQTAREAATGSKPAAQQLAAAAAPNPETAAAAERLGISNYLQPDHVTTNDGFRQVLGVLKSNPTSQLALQEKEGLAKVAERASKLIDDVGGTNDLSQLDAGVKTRMQQTHTELSTREDKLYQTLREKIGPTTDAPASNALAFAEQRARDLGGQQNLSPMEKALVAKLSPKGGGDEAMLDALGPAAKQQALEQGAGAVKQPTYALLDDVRRDVGAAARQKGPFSDADTGLAKKYYSLLSQDQGAVAQAAGMGDVAQAARAATTARKGMEDDLAALFGKNLDQSLVPQVSGAMRAAATGDAAKLLAVLKATPDSMKQEVVASGLGSVFRNAATRGEINFTGYAKWYEGLQRNQQAYTAVMAHLPPAARQQLADLYRVSKGISDSLSARIKTGLRSSVLQELQGAPDSLAHRLFELAKHAGKGLAVDAAGGHGAGLAMGLFSALKGNAKPNAVKAIDELLTSPEFQHMASSAGTQAQPEAVRRFAYSKVFTKFARAVGNPRELSNREKWVLQALQTRNNMD